MPAAAVIPALKAYIDIVAVKKLVVGSESLAAVHFCATVALTIGWLLLAVAD